jgi:small-conductance mechanosensitive channel
MKLFFKFIITTYFFIFIANLNAAEDVAVLNSVIINKVLDQAERELKRKIVRINKLDEYNKKIKVHRTWAISCVAEKEKAILTLSEKLKVLGDKVKGETLSVSKKRTDFFKEETKLRNELVSCNVIIIRVEELSDNINFVEQKTLAQQLLAKGPTFFKLILENWDNPSLWTDALKTFVIEHSGLLDLEILDISILIFFLIIIIYISKIYSKKISIWSSGHTPKPHLLSQLTCALATTIERYIFFVPAIYFAVAIFNFNSIDITPKPFIVIGLNGLAIVVTLNMIIHFFLNSSLSINKHDPGTKQKAFNLVHRLKVLVTIIFFGYLLFSTLLFHGLSEVVLLMSRAIYGTILVLNLVWVIWLIGYFHKFGNKLIVKISLSFIFITALSIEWLGYRNFSLYILEIVIGTLFLLGLYSVISTLISEFMDSLEKGISPMAVHVRNWFGVRNDQRIRGIIWIRLIITLSMWLAFISLIIIIWQVPDAYTQLLMIKVVEGISIGSFKLIPLQILEAVVVFSSILLITSWFKRRLEKQWLPKTTIARSARESLATISGYIGILIAMVFALSFIGLDFSKLALVAGALSVGIGFGLQNVVNNFISGLILLFERPIKTGDWIEVAGTEGHVKRISIRSTLIQTFDRADVIIPNSEIISGTVTNWMLRDHSGRIRVPIGVAYGSNTDLIRDLLLEVANDHSDIIKGNSVIEDPKVLFIAFGDSSLEFELRCHIYNIDNRRMIISDLNFAIDKIFRKNNISIPFPQRDVHIINDNKDSDSSS